MTITNDGATILKLLEVEHPAAKVLCELADLQDKEVGDGTTSVVHVEMRAALLEGVGGVCVFICGLQVSGMGRRCQDWPLEGRPVGSPAQWELADDPAGEKRITAPDFQRMESLLKC